MGNILPEMGAEMQADSLDEEEAVIVMEIAKVIEMGRKDKLPALRYVPKKKLLEETAKVDQVLSKFKTHSITKTNELSYTGASNFRHWERVERKYSIIVKRLNVVIE